MIEGKEVIIRGAETELQRETVLDLIRIYANREMQSNEAGEEHAASWIGRQSGARVSVYHTDEAIVGTYTKL